MRAFVAASRHHNVGRAAVSLNLTPSPVSRAIHGLERDLGVVLFERRYHELKLTAAGEAALTRAVEILAQTAALQREAKGDTYLSPLRIGSTPWAPNRYVERLTTVLGDLDEPETNVDLEMSSELLHSLRHGDLDIALVHLPVTYPDIAVRELGRYKFVAFRDASTEPFHVSELRLRDLAGRTILTLPSNLQPAPMLATRDRLLEAGVAAVNEMDLRDVVTLTARLRKTGEIMLGTHSEDTPLSRLTDTSSLLATPIADGEIDFKVGVAWRSRDGMNLERILRIVNLLRSEAGSLDEIV